MKQYINFKQYKSNDGIVRIKDSSGNDWYDVREMLSPDTLKIMYNDKKEILSISTDGYFMFPIDASIMELPYNSKYEDIDGIQLSLSSLNKITVSSKWADDFIRTLRNSLLAATDFLMMPDVEISDKDKKEITQYRKLLRNLTDEELFPFVELPKVPTIAKSHIDSLEQLITLWSKALSLK